jgi:hypothetical protein
MDNKKFSPASITALKEALINIYWKKQDLKNFLKLSLENDAILVTINWEYNKKFESVNELVDRMIARKDIYYDDLIRLIYDVSNFNDFSHLKIWDDSEIKIAKAKESVQRLRQFAQGYFHVEEEKIALEKRRKKTQDHLESLKKSQEQIESLKQEFLILAMESNPQKRGILLESFLYKLFSLFDLEPKRSFSLKDEQIDGAFTFENGDYLLEAKWQKEPVETGELKKFSGTLNDKQKNTLGLFISIDGFSKGAVEFSGPNARSIILMDGMDLSAVLDQRIDLHHLLFRKRRHASETGEIYYPAFKIMNE